MEFKSVQIFTSLDLEMNQPSGKIIQIGAIVGNVETGDILERLSIFVNPMEELNPTITALTKITQEDVDGGETIETAYEKLKEIHLKHNSYMNALVWGGGDSAELLRQLKIANPEFKDWRFGRRWIDTKTLYISWRIANKLPPKGGLSRAMKNIGLEFRGHAHDARWDAENTFHMYRKMLELFKNGQEPSKVLGQ